MLNATQSEVSRLLGTPQEKNPDWQCGNRETLFSRSRQPGGARYRARRAAATRREAGFIRIRTARRLVRGRSHLYYRRTFKAVRIEFATWVPSVSQPAWLKWTFSGN